MTIENGHFVDAGKEDDRRSHELLRIRRPQGTTSRISDTIQIISTILSTEQDEDTTHGLGY